MVTFLIITSTFTAEITVRKKSNNGTLTNILRISSHRGFFQLNDGKLGGIFNK
jgi:hypothetical protein